MLLYRFKKNKGVGIMLTGKKIRDMEMEKALMAELKWFINKSIDNGDILFEHLDPLFDILYKIQEG